MSVPFRLPQETLTRGDQPACWTRITHHPAHVHTSAHTSVTCDSPVSQPRRLSSTRMRSAKISEGRAHIPASLPAHSHSPAGNQAPHICCGSNCYSLFIPSINKLHRSPGIFLENFRVLQQNPIILPIHKLSALQKIKTHHTFPLTFCQGDL